MVLSTHVITDTGPGDDFPRLNMARRDGFEGPLASNDKSDTARIEPTPPLGKNEQFLFTSTV
jgi:hypothetical protein